MPEDTGYESEEYEVDGVDVSDVLAWAQDCLDAETTFSIHVLAPGKDGPTLIRLAGEDPTIRVDSGGAPVAIS